MHHINTDTGPRLHLCMSINVPTNSQVNSHYPHLFSRLSKLANNMPLCTIHIRSILWFIIQPEVCGWFTDTQGASHHTSAIPWQHCTGEDTYRKNMRQIQRNKVTAHADTHVHIHTHAHKCKCIHWLNLLCGMAIESCSLYK